MSIAAEDVRYIFLILMFGYPFSGEARDCESVSESEQAADAAGIEASSDIWDGRRHRLLASQKTIPALEGCVVILGRIVTVGSA